MLCEFGERERQRERTCREAGRGKEGERERGGREGGAEGGRETEPLRRTGVLEPSQLRFQPLREAGRLPQRTPWSKLPSAYGGIITVRSCNISRACVLSPDLAT